MADTTALFARATRAFVDRASIDWGRLLFRVRHSDDRRLFETLRTLAAVRNAAHSAPEASRVARFAISGARMVTALAAIEIAGAVVTFGFAFASGAASGLRPAQIALALAF